MTQGTHSVCTFKIFPSLTKVSHLGRRHFFIPTISLFGLVFVFVGAEAGSLERINLLRRFGGRRYATIGGFENVSLNRGSLFIMVRWCLPMMAGTDGKAG